MVLSVFYGGGLDAEIDRRICWWARWARGRPELETFDAATGIRRWRWRFPGILEMRRARDKLLSLGVAVKLVEVRLKVLVVKPMPARPPRPFVPFEFGRPPRQGAYERTTMDMAELERIRAQKMGGVRSAPVEVPMDERQQRRLRALRLVGLD